MFGASDIHYRFERYTDQSDCYVIKPAMACADGSQQRSMASADGGEEEPGGSQLAVPDGPQVGSQLAVPDGAQLALYEQLPEQIVIGTKKAFAGNYPFPYVKREIGEEKIYVCNKGSGFARDGEVLVLRRQMGIWTAFDSSVGDENGGTLYCRQPVFRCVGENITKPGYYNWETNSRANFEDDASMPNWESGIWAETRVG